MQQLKTTPNLGILPWPPLPDVIPIYRAAQSFRLPRL